MNPPTESFKQARDAFWAAYERLNGLRHTAPLADVEEASDELEALRAVYVREVDLWLTLHSTPPTVLGVDGETPTPTPTEEP